MTRRERCLSRSRCFFFPRLSLLLARRSHYYFILPLLPRHPYCYFVTFPVTLLPHHACCYLATPATTSSLPRRRESIRRLAIILIRDVWVCGSPPSRG